MFSFVGTLRIFFIFLFFTQMCAKRLVKMCANFGKTCSPVSDLWAYTTQAKACISFTGLIGLIRLNSLNITSEILRRS